MPAPLVLLPLWPRQGVVESLDWMTYVMVSEDGSEEATQLRLSPRQAFRMSYYVSSDRQARINNIVYGGRTLQWWVPAWPQVQSVGPVTAGLTVLPCETRYSEFRDGGFLMLWDSPEHCQIIEINAVTGDTAIALASATEAFEDAWLMPVRVGYLDQAPGRQLNGRNSVLTMNFNVEDNEALVVPAPAQYLGLDLYTDPGLLNGGELGEQLTARFDVFDEGTGPVSYAAPWVYNRPARVHRMMGADAAEAWAIRQFLHRRMGRSVQFWLPTFEADFRVNDSGPITGSLSVYPDDYVGFAAAREHVAIETPAGWLARRITATNLLGANELQLVFDASLGGVQASAIKRISFLGRKRLDTDRAEVNWIGGTASTCAVSTVEIAP